MQVEDYIQNRPVMYEGIVILYLLAYYEFKGLTINF